MSTSTFEVALAHVLALEGSYSNDPQDPGGPTNYGITLEDYTRFKHVDAGSSNRSQLIEELKHIPPAVVRSIYLERYWHPSRSDKLPAPLALFHFDTAVNQGLGAASRLLQKALQVQVDGEIGPFTLQAAKAAEDRTIIERYARLRRTRYRELAHFSRFGRGWLNRVDATVKKSLAMIDTSRVAENLQMGESPMPEIQHGERSAPGTKWWGHSLTIWGALITAAATVLPTLAPIGGLELNAELVRQIGAQSVQVAEAVGGLVGTVMTIYGRSRASTMLERRELRLQL